jgi:hypothetical protein
MPTDIIDALPGQRTRGRSAPVELPARRVRYIRVGHPVRAADAFKLQTMNAGIFLVLVALIVTGFWGGLISSHFNKSEKVVVMSMPP